MSDTRVQCETCPACGHEFKKTSLTTEERVKLILAIMAGATEPGQDETILDGIHEVYCKHCGREKTLRNGKRETCHCWNDE